MSSPLATGTRGICLRCFGRAFGKEGSGFTNLERGSNFLSSGGDKLEQNGYVITSDEKCSICNGLFQNFGKYYDMISADLGKTEFNTILVGSTFDQDTLLTEAAFQEIFGNRGESIKREFNREFGKYLSDRTGKEADLVEPDLTVLMDLRYDSYKLQNRSIFVYGTYKKLRRDIPQTRWIHRRDTDASVESIIGEIFREMTESRNYFLHGAGREDVDVRMLGNGREFIIECTDPVRRSVSLDFLKQTVNEGKQGVEIDELRFASKSDVVSIKGSTHDKSYRATIKFTGAVNAEHLRHAAEKLSGKDIYQRTPLRVSTRRSDLIRKKGIRSVSVEEIGSDTAIIRIRAEAGTYIKELVNGDEGRTEPSLAQLYGGPLQVNSLDVVWIHRNGD